MGAAPVIDNLFVFELLVTFGLMPFGHPLVSSGLPDFKFYDEIFYIDYEYNGLRRKKPVPHNIHELLTPRALAYWFMDDGSYRYKNRAYRFSTHSFHPNPVWVSFSAYPFEDQQIFVQALKDNFDIETTIQKDHQYSTLYIREKSTERFVNLIRPYLHPCFDSKIKNTAEGPSP